MAFPNAFTAAVDAVTTVAAALINQLETKVGVNNSTDANSLDYKVSHLLSSLTGIIFPFGGVSAPTGFLLCDGSAVSRTTYATLFGVIGVAYGVGNGSTTFNLPDLRDRSAVGKAASGARGTLGAVGGSSADHTHTEGSNILSAPVSHIGGGTQIMIVPISEDTGVGWAAGVDPITSGGGNTGATSGVDPYQVVNYIIKY